MISKLKNILLVALYVLCVSISIRPSMAATVEKLRDINISSLIATIDGLPVSVRISAVSADGSVIIGTFTNPEYRFERRVFRFTKLAGIEDLGKFSDQRIEGLCMSSDGKIIWGKFYFDNGKHHVFRHTLNEGLQDLGTLGKSSIDVNAVSADGSSIVGSYQHSMLNNTPLYHAFRYSESRGFEDLGTMGAESAFARGVSADREIIVGNFHPKDGTDRAFRYTRSEGRLDIGEVGGAPTFALGVSANGNVVVGIYFYGSGFIADSFTQHAFLYTKAGGLQKLGALGGKSVGTISISEDGTKISASYMDSNDESWVYSGIIK